MEHCKFVVAIFISSTFEVNGMQAEIGIIGGTGLYDPKLLKNIQEVTVETPYGKPSDSITVGELAGKSVAFLPRHGKKHTIRPTDINVQRKYFCSKEPWS